MKDEARKIIGKTLSGLIVKDCDRRQLRQLFLLFDDGTYYEFYGPGKVVTLEACR